MKSRWLISTVLAVMAVSRVTGLAVMSVDLGSEWMKVAVVSPGVPMEIALNPESKRKTAAAVSIKDGERYFGADALVKGVRSPKHCYMHLLDLLGKKMDNPMVSRFQSQFPHYTLVKDPIRETVLFQHDDETFYSPEELLGMILAHAKTQAETFTEQKIKDAVITVPVYFNQAERKALIAAANMGGLNVLQLMNVPSAVALNYGMFRRKEINGTVRHIMFYDMGSQQTTAALVGFQIVKTKERGFSETHPQAQILGIGYDRTLGGTEMTLRLRQWMADQFNALGKTKTDVRTVPRAMAKLLKEAGRVKTILSANTETFVMIENVMEDIDLKGLKVTREQLMELCSDLMDRVTAPIDTALKTAEMTMDLVDQLIIVGGGTRVPRVQEELQKYKKELGKNLNSDEAAAMGAVYKAADLSSGFKVKKFITKEAVIFPIDVDFEREFETDAGEKGTKKVKRTLFSKMNPYPQKKIMTFNKHIKDFDFHVNYDELDHLSDVEISYIGSLNISTVHVKGVGEALEKNNGENVETKGVKAHFALDDSGILTCTNTESVFEKTVSVEEQEKEEKKAKDDDTWAKLGSTISNFFGGEKEEGKAGGEAKDEETGEKAEGDNTEAKEPPKEEVKEETEKKDKKEKKGGEKYDTKQDQKEKNGKDKDKEKDKKKEEKKEPKKPKVETLKEELGMEFQWTDAPLEGELFEASKTKLEQLDQLDKDRAEHETALNELQSFVFDVQDKLYQEEYEKASTDEEREKIRDMCSTTSDWLDEEAGPSTPTTDFKEKLKVLKELTSALFARVREHTERPEALEALDKTLNSSKSFLEKSRNLTGDDEFFKEKELDQLSKKIEEIEKWQGEKTLEQSEHSLSEMPKLTVSMIVAKIHDLESEVKFLVSQAKMRKAEKEREKRLKEAEEKKAEEEAKKKEKKEKKEKEKAEKAKKDAETETSDKETAADSTKEHTEEIPKDSDTGDSDSENVETVVEDSDEPKAKSDQSSFEPPPKLEDLDESLQDWIKQTIKSTEDPSKDNEKTEL